MFDKSGPEITELLLQKLSFLSATKDGMICPPLPAPRLPKAAERPDEDRVVTPEEWAQIRLQLAGEGTLLLRDLALDCGLR